MTPGQNDLQDLLDSYRNSPQPSYKVTNYFPIYVELFAHLRGTACTFIETGVLNGGSLFMWRSWLGEQARIIGIDLNPGAQRWAEHGFEIYLGDQGDPEFWRRTLDRIGEFDALLDDGGHQSFQQIVTVYEAIGRARRRCVVAVEDTCTSFMKKFSRHGDRSFLEYCKDATDNLLANTSHFFPGEFPTIRNQENVEHFRNVHSIQFFSGIVAFRINPAAATRPELVWNHEPTEPAADFRFKGVDSAVVQWPGPFDRKAVTVKGGRT